MNWCNKFLRFKFILLKANMYKNFKILDYLYDTTLFMKFYGTFDTNFLCLFGTQRIRKSGADL